MEAPSPALQRFIEANGRHWTPAVGSEERGVILTDGIVAGYGPNYLVRTGMVAKALEEETGCRPIVLFDDFPQRVAPLSEAYRSFGIDRFSYLRGGLEDLLLIWKAYRLASQWLRRPQRGDALVDLHFHDLHIGDIIYDDILHAYPNLFTMSRVPRRYLRNVATSFLQFYRLDRFFRRHRVRMVAATHVCYTPFGIMARLGIRYGAEVIETTDATYLSFSPGPEAPARFYPTQQVALRRSVAEVLNGFPSDDSPEREAERALAQRFAGDIRQADVYYAFKVKRMYTKEELREALGIRDERPIVFLMAHVFNDTPHSSDWSLFRDYYLWIRETIRLARGIRDVVWVVKPHPSGWLMHDNSSLDRAVGGGNVFMCPADLSGASIPAVASALVTVQGTAGIEFSCCGIPVVLAGSPFYAGHGFTIEPRTRAAYEDTLRRIAGVDPLSPDQIRTARRLFSAYLRCRREPSRIIDMGTLFKVWGYEGRRDVDEAIHRIVRALAVENPREDPTYRSARETGRRLKSAG